MSGLLTPAGATAAGTVTVAASTVVVGDVTIELGAISVFYGGGVTLVGGAVAGAIAGAISGGILGGWHGALLGQLSGALFGAIGGAYGNSWSLSPVAWTSVAGGIASDASGQGFWRGFDAALAVSLVSWGYRSINQGKYDPKWSGGDGHEDKPPALWSGDPAGRDFGADGTCNAFGKAWSGIGGRQVPGWLYKNSGFSKFMDSLFGMNATAVLHDNLMAAIFRSTNSFFYNVAFVPSMPIAAGMAYTTLAGPASVATVEDNRQ